MITMHKYGKIMLLWAAMLLLCTLHAQETTITTIGEEAEFVDLGLTSGTLWKTTNEPGYYTFAEMREQFEYSQMPTRAQLIELVEECKWIWRGNGCEVLGRNGNSIFLPVTGFRTCDGTEKYTTSTANYWAYTASPDPDHAFVLFVSAGGYEVDMAKRCSGRAVRLVKGKAETIL